MAKKPAAPRRGASRKPAARRNQRRGVPGWVWLVAGLAAGLFIAFLFGLGNLRKEQVVNAPLPPAGQQRPATTTPPAATQPAKPADKPAEQAPRFDFYAVLPQMEVIVPKEEPATPARPTAPATGNNTANNRTSTPAGNAASNEQFQLQAGSFRRSQDADRRRAELAMQGFEARVQPVALDSGDTWYRVMIGPFNNVNAMHSAQDKLVGVGIETLPIRVRGG